MSEEITCGCCKSFPKACGECGARPAPVAGPDAVHSALHLWRTELRLANSGRLKLFTQYLCDTCFERIVFDE